MCQVIHNYGCVSIDLDFVSAVSLLGPATDRWTLDALERAGLSGLRTPHGYLIQRLLVREHTVTDLATALGVSQQAVSKVAAELVADGYLVRLTDERDRRRQPLALTERGRTAVDTARLSRVELVNKLVAAVGADEIEAARGVLIACLTELGLWDDIHQRSVPMPRDTA